MKLKTFSPEIDAVHKIQGYVSDHLPADYQSPEKVFQIELIIEEVVINIVNYAFTDVKNGFITVGVGGKEKAFTVEIRDNGSRFNPLEIKAPDLEAPLDQREPGGLGIFLVRQLSGQVTYSRLSGNNILRLVF